MIKWIFDVTDNEFVVACIGRVIDAVHMISQRIFWL